MKKSFDAVDFQRKARRKVSRLYSSRPQELRKHLRRKYGVRAERALPVGEK